MAVYVSGDTVSIGANVSRYWMIVLDGGSVYDTEVNSEGRLYIRNSGSAETTTVNAGGALYVSSGGSAVGNTINLSGYVAIENGGSVDGITINTGAKVYINAGGNALNITENGGYCNVASGATVSFVPNVINDLELGDLAALHSGTVANNAVVLPLGRIDVYSGGAVNWAAANGGRICVYDGGEANSATVDFNGRINTYSGGTVNCAVINDGSLYVYNGGAASFATVNADGSAYVVNGGEVSSIAIGSGGSLLVSSGGSASGITIDAGGHLSLASGGVAVGIDADAAAILNIVVAKKTSASGTLGGATFELKNAGLSNFSVTSGCTLDVYTDGSISNITVNPGARVIVSGGGANLIENGGEVQVESGAAVSFSPHTIENLTLYEKATLHSGTVAESVTIEAGGQLYIYASGSAHGVTVNSSGYVCVDSCGVIENAMINVGGEIFVTSGGAANRTNVNGGNLDVFSGGYASNVNVSSGGALEIASGGVVTDVSIDANAFMYVESDGVASNATINAGGEMIVFNGGAADKIVENGGYVDVIDGAEATFAANTFSGLALSNASATLHSGTVAINTMVNTGGRLCVYDGGAQRGKLTVAASDGVYVFSGGVIDLWVAETSAADDYLINDLSLISGTPTYTITVNDDQTFGTYRLAQGAGDFAGTMSIGNGTTAYGTLTVNGAKVTYNERDYRLRLDDGDLTLSVVGPDMPKPEIGPASFTATAEGALYTAEVYSELGSALLQYKLDDGDWATAAAGTVLVTSNAELSLRAIDDYEQVSDAKSYQVLFGTDTPLVEFIGAPDADGNVLAGIAGSVTGAVYGAGVNTDVAGRVELEIAGGALSSFAAGGANVSGESRQTTGSVSLELADVNLNNGATARIIAGGLVSNSGSYTIGGDLNVDLDGVSAASITYGGARVESGSTFELTGDLNLSIASGSYQAVYAAGNAIKNGGDLIYDQDVNLTISGGTFNSYVGTGAQVSTGTSCTVAGDTNLTISGGTFNKQVFGGAYSQGGDATVEGNVYLTITGGTFNGNIYAGGYATGGNSAKLMVVGSTYVTLDASVNTITFGSGAALFGGSVDSGTVGGDTKLTITGTDANLVFTGNNVLMGDSLMYQDTKTSYVGGNRSITFDNYVGNMSALLYAFDELDLVNGSQVSFGSTQKYLRNISTWNVELDATAPVLAISGANNFYHDTLNLMFDEEISGATVVDGGSLDSLKNWDKLSAVTFNGEAAAWSEELGAFVDADNQWSLSLGGDNDLVLTKQLA